MKAEPRGRVLLVEDNPMNLELAVDLLEAAGFDVLTAEEADAGIRIARTIRPDVILMDISLPGTDGLAATRVLKGDPATSSIPVVALTAHAMRGDEEKARAAGCDGYLTKPIDTRTFALSVAAFVRNDAAGSGPCPTPSPSP